MNLQQRIEILTNLGEYLVSEEEEWQQVKDIAQQKNPWFTQQFIDLAAHNISHNFLKKELLYDWAEKYKIPSRIAKPRSVGIVMAGNIPLVGFHDFLCVFINGHQMRIKTSSKDEELMKHLVKKLMEWDKQVAEVISFEQIIRGCDAYIATGSNNTSRYFDYYFARYPHIIRRNKTSVAIVTGKETNEQLSALADDIHLYFGLGCRNVTKIFVPDGYDFIPFIEACKKYNYFLDMQKYKNNYDYQLALHLMNNIPYMSSGALLISENKEIFTPLSRLNYEYYLKIEDVSAYLLNHQDVQCIVGKHFLPFGQAQSPGLSDFADGVDTMKFMRSL